MSFGEAVRTCFQKYADFSGRASRPEYWWFALFTVLVYAALFVLASAVGTASDALAGLVALLLFAAILGLILPSIAAAVRRLHDTGRSGWWYLIGLVPYVGGLVLIVLLALEGTPGANQYGFAPGAPAHAVVPPMPPPPSGVPGSGFTYR